jgi:O-glycosyl hydrolase
MGRACTPAFYYFTCFFSRHQSFKKGRERIVGGIVFNNRKFIWIAMAGIVSWFGAGTLFSQTITLTSQTAQVIDGFGLSDSWSGNDMMNNVPAKERDSAMNRFFSQTGAGLTMVRNRLVSDTDGDYQGQIKFCLRAKALGATTFFSSVWNPPAACLNTQGKIVSANFSKYAQYIVDYVKGMAQAGVAISKIGVQNEPDIGGTGYFNSANDLRDFSIVLRQQLDNNQLSGVRLMNPECSGWEHSRDYLQSQLSTTQGAQAVDIFATHDYWGAERDSTLDPVRDTVAKWAGARGKHVWQTEYSRYDCIGACSGACAYPNVSSDPNQVMSQPAVNSVDGLAIANFLYKDLSRGNVNGWAYWWTHNPNRGCAGHNSFNGLLILKADTTFFYPKRFYAVSHYSRFLKPGSVRLVLTTTPATALKQLHPVAFWDSVKKSIAVVIYTTSTTALPYTINFSGVPQFSGYCSVKKHLTSTDLAVNVAENDSRTLGQGQDYSSTLSAMSIETVVFSGAPSACVAGRSTAEGSFPTIAVTNGRVIGHAAANEKTVFRIFDITGRTVARDARRVDRSGDVTLTVAKHVAPGVYLVQLTTPRGIALRRVRF